MVDAGERMPVRLVQENGNTISLDATAIDIIVERRQSAFGLPFFDAKRMGIDLNQADVRVEISGVFADDVGQEQTAQAVATMDFYQPQQLVTWGQPIGGSTGGTNSGPISSMFNLGGSTGSVFGGITTGIGGALGGFGGFTGGNGGSLGGGVMDVKDLGNRVLRYWNERYIDFPVGYWVEETIGLENPVQTGLQLWLSADTLSSTHSDGDAVASWTELSNARSATATGVERPTFRDAGPRPFVQFDGGSDRMTVASSPFLNTEEFTIFAVFKPDANTGNNTVLATSNGYHLTSEPSNTRVVAGWYDGATMQTVNSGASSVLNSGLSIVGYTMEDTGADAEADEAKVYVNGTLKNTSSGLTYEPDGGVLYIGGNAGSDYFEGGIYELLVYNRVLSDDERELVEGYLSVKYNVLLAQGHPYRQFRYTFEKTHVRVGFDQRMVASQQEPYGFLNDLRSTGLVVQSISGNVLTIDTGTGDPRQWFEVDESTRQYPISSASNRISPSFVTAVTASTITVNPPYGTMVIQVGDTIDMHPITYNEPSLIGGYNSPVVIIPIKNADTFDAQALPEKAVGPEFPAHQDGSSRDDGGGIERTDEYIAYLLSKALTASYFDLNRDVDADGNQTMDKVFSVEISESANGHNARLTITQQYPSSLGRLSGSINSSLGVGQMPVTQGFSGGRSGKRVKSGGDKVQDVLGVLANSNNFANNIEVNNVSQAIQIGLDFLSNQFYSPDVAGDYIHGIQIPYTSLATKGKNALDSEVAQRNFFLTTKGGTASKMSSANDVHASRAYAAAFHGHLKNGISGLVSQFVVHRDAEMKAYEFELQFAAADIIL